MFLLVSLILMGKVAAKYFIERKKETLYTAGAFYFESDLLTNTSSIKTYTYKEGTNEIELVLTNNIDDLRYSEVDIFYKVTITDLNGGAITDKDENNISEILGKLEKGKIDSQIVKFSNLKTGSYIVNAISTAPYEKSLKANFVITDRDDDIQFNVKDAINSPVAQLTISTKDYNGNIKITWPKGITPDNTNFYFFNNNSNYEGSNKTIQISSNSEIIIQFFKEDLSKQYLTDDFKVERCD